MTKNIFIVAIAVLLSVAFCSLSAQNVSKDYNCRRLFCQSTCNLSEILFSLNRQNVPAVWKGLLNL